ncbi:MAG: DNA methyltransferase [Myxococcota bacterium]
MTRLLRLTTRGDDRVLDFFAGSGTTGHAVLTQNAQDGGARRFVLVQLPEPTGRADFPTISRLAEERLRRAIASVGTGGFRVMTLGE